MELIIPIINTSSFPDSTNPVETISWQEILSNTISDIDELLSMLSLSKGDLPVDAEAMKEFPLKVPAPYLERIEKGNPDDPLFLQIFPSAMESIETESFTKDPLEENQFNVRPGMLHKYNGRVLLIATGSCAIHCRYCFRRHFPYDENRPGKEQWQETMEYIRQDDSISEVILSGGDPLTLSDKYLAWFYQELAAISHIKRVRLHTRIPIMIPQRINKSLLGILANTELQTILVLHSNHAQELDKEVLNACHALHHAGLLTFNQSVLLKGINSSAEALVALSERLCEAKVIPYYLHLLDKVQGAGHFEVNEKEAVRLMKRLQKTLPGFLVPKLVRESVGAMNKTVLPIV